MVGEAKTMNMNRGVGRATPTGLLAPVNGIVKLGPEAIKNPLVLVEALGLEKLSPVDKGFYGFVASPELTEDEWRKFFGRIDVVEKALAFFTESIVSINNTRPTEIMEYHTMTFRGLSKVISLAKYSMENFSYSSIRKTEEDYLIYEVILGEEDYFNFDYALKIFNFDFV